MKLFFFITMTSMLLACGSGRKGTGSEDSVLGSLSVNTTVPSQYLPIISKVDITVRSVDLTETTYTLANLSANKPDLMIPAGDYTVNVKLYQKENGENKLFAQTVKDHPLCPEPNTTIKGGSRTEMNIVVCTIDNTVKMENSGGSAAINVGIVGFQKFLRCDLPAGTPAIYKSMGIEASLKPDNKAESFRLVLGKQNADGSVVDYAAPLKLDSSTTTSSTANFDVLSSSGDKIGSLKIYGFYSDRFQFYSLQMNDGNNISSVNSSNYPCYLATIRPESPMNFIKGL